MVIDRLAIMDLFSGFGGFSLGLERTGYFETKAFCEIEDYPRRVLAKHWPDVPIYRDIRELKGEDIEKTHGPIDLVCGGFPCQPFSAAGQRRGTGDHRHLWPEMLRIIKELHPAWVLGENVNGLGTMVFDRSRLDVESRVGGVTPDGADYEAVYLRKEQMLLHSICEDFDSIGYAVQIFRIPACAVDLPHRRDRLWIVANAIKRAGKRSLAQSGIGPLSRGDESGNVADSERPERGPAPGGGDIDNRPKTGREKTPNGRGERGENSNVDNAERAGLERLAWHGVDGAGRAEPDGSITATGFRGESEWLAGNDGKHRRVKSGICLLADGVPGRVGQLRGFGNAVIPAIPEAFGHAIAAAHREFY